MQTPGKCSATGICKYALTFNPTFVAHGMALWGDRMAFVDWHRGTVRVCDMAGVQLHTFGTLGQGRGEFLHPSALCAHPNGNLLVLEGSYRVQEITWTGDHVRFISTRAINGRRPIGVGVSLDGSLIALVAVTSNYGPTTIDLLDGSTCALVRRIVGWTDARSGPSPIRFSPHGNRAVITCAGLKPAMFRMCANENGRKGPGGSNVVNVGTEFGTPDKWGECQHFEFTDEGDVVAATRDGATVYSGTTLEAVRSWPWLRMVRWIYGIQAHRGRLYVLCRVEDHGNDEVHVYE